VTILVYTQRLTSLKLAAAIDNHCKTLLIRLGTKYTSSQLLALVKSLTH